MWKVNRRMHWLYLQLSCRNVSAGGQSTNEHTAETMVSEFLLPTLREGTWNCTSTRRGYRSSRAHQNPPEQSKAQRHSCLLCAGMKQDSATVRLGVLPVEYSLHEGALNTLKNSQRVLTMKIKITHHPFQRNTVCTKQHILKYLHSLWEEFCYAVLEMETKWSFWTGKKIWW